MSQTALSQDTHHTVSKSASHVLLGTLLSRLTGFFREVALGTWMGATGGVANFLIAYRFSQLLRRLFGESTLLSSFSPHFEALRLEGEEKAQAFFRDLLGGLTLLISVILVVLETVLFFLLSYQNLSDDLYDTLYLTAVMLPGVIFVCLYALFSALLQTQRRYFATSVAPLLFNLTFTALLFLVKDAPSHQSIRQLSWGVVVAFFFQFLSVACLTIPFLKQIEWTKIRIWTPDIQKITSAMGMTMLGVGAVQINSFIDTVFAKVSSHLGPAYLYYASRLYQLPIALLSLALVSALIPPLARARGQNDREGFVKLFRFALQKNLIVMIPLTFLFFIAGPSFVNVVYGRGAFDQDAVIATTWCLWGYGIGLIPSTMALLLTPPFYAKKDFRTPLKASLLSVGVNLCLNSYLIYCLQIGPAGIALATTVAASVHVTYLWKKLSSQEGVLLGSENMRVIKKVVLCALGSALVTGGVDVMLSPGSFITLFTGDFQSFEHTFLQLLYLGFQGALFTSCFFLLAYLIKVKAVSEMIVSHERKA
ncbi:MAG: murein biosynthesis integral membrane protein MurJ [Candidatus Rhabdochlamydia sp.]